jgi:hypothetical protein
LLLHDVLLEVLLLAGIVAVAFLVQVLGHVSPFLVVGAFLFIFPD